MGKKNRKHRAKYPAQTKSVKPDDYFRMGSLEMARFGRVVVGRSNMTVEEFEAAQVRLVERFPEVSKEIDEKISKIVELVKVLPPDELLKRAYWNFALHHLDKQTEVELGSDAALSLRMIDYIQSVIVSVPPSDEIFKTVTDERWHELETLVEALFSQISLDYQICLTAYNRRDPNFTKDLEEYYFKAQVYWCNVRGRRYLIHEIPFLRDVLTPHDGVLSELYGVTVEELLRALEEIQDSLTLGLGKLMTEMDEFRKLTLAQVKIKIDAGLFLPSDSLPTLIDKVVAENDWEAWRRNIFGRFAALDLFDLEKIASLPKQLLEDLSWGPGENTEFFADGAYKGWPLRVWPVFVRPFIKLERRYYCFEIYSLFDHFYRIIQRLILRKKPEYAETWNRKQNAVAEHAPIDLLNKILPGATVFKNVYYRWQVTGGRTDWCQTDGLLIYDQHLFILEIRAGAFTYSAPATDFPAYIASLRNLVLKPAEQGKRFLQYLESEETVTLYDCNHEEIGHISRRNFEHVTICAVTLDSFTELAAQVQHLRPLGVDVGTQPVWAASIDDLRVYADIFDNPLIFLHFVEERMRAFQSDLIRTDDELDHLGLYLKHNIYTQYVKNFKGRTIWYGYRSEIDRYFMERFVNPNAAFQLKQNMPPLLKEIIDILATSNRAGRTNVASILLNISGEWRKIITSGVSDVLRRQSALRRAKPLSTHGDVKLTVFCWQKTVLKRDEEFALEHAKAAMLLANDNKRLLLELMFDASGKLSDVDYSFLRRDNIAAPDLERLEAFAESLRARRIEEAMQNRKRIGRNEYCPCGSGKKYKRCCIVRSRERSKVWPESVF